MYESIYGKKKRANTYTFSSLNFSKLASISPEVTPPQSKLRLVEFVRPWPHVY